MNLGLSISLAGESGGGGAPAGTTETFSANYGNIPDNGPFTLIVQANGSSVFNADGDGQADSSGSWVYMSWDDATLGVGETYSITASVSAGALWILYAESGGTNGYIKAYSDNRFIVAEDGQTDYYDGFPGSWTGTDDVYSITRTGTQAFSVEINSTSVTSWSTTITPSGTIGFGSETGSDTISVKELEVV